MKLNDLKNYSFEEIREAARSAQKVHPRSRTNIAMRGRCKIWVEEVENYVCELHSEENDIEVKR